MELEVQSISPNSRVQGSVEDMVAAPLFLCSAVSVSLPAAAPTVLCGVCFTGASSLELPSGH